MPDLRPITARLADKLSAIEQLMMQLLDISPIERFRNDPESMIVVLGPSHHFSKGTEEQKRLQLLVQEQYSRWLEQFRLLFQGAPHDMKRQIAKTDEFVTSWINLNGSFAVPATTSKAKERFSEEIKVFAQLLKLREGTGKQSMIVVPDTNALIRNPNVLGMVPIAGTTSYTAILTSTVIRELDILKSDYRKDPDFRKKVDGVIQRITGLRNQGSINAGVTVNKTVTIKMFPKEPDFKKTLSWLDSQVNDDRLIATALEIQRGEPSSIVVLVTSDMNMQSKAELAELPFVETP